MKPYKSWQEALIYFTRAFGEDYEDSYTLIKEFEQHLLKNNKGTYFLRRKK